MQYLRTPDLQNITKQRKAQKTVVVYFCVILKYDFRKLRKNTGAEICNHENRARSGVSQRYRWRFKTSEMLRPVDW